MEVQLYIYDLSQGMARQLSRQLTGTFIEAIYHTSIVVGGVEYFYGHGIYRKQPGSTHHGNPIEIQTMGLTELPSDIIDEYVQSLEEIYTPEAYDLFHNNCNNFTQDMSVFLVGKDIPAKIRELPSTFLSTPMGQMLRGVLDQSLRTMTQAPDAVSGQSVSVQRPPEAHSNVTVGENHHSLGGDSRGAFANGVSEIRYTLYPHPHTRLRLPNLQYKIRAPVMYKRQPPLEKLTAKLGEVGKEKMILQIVEYVRKGEANGADETTLPNLAGFAEEISRLRAVVPPENQFALVDLLRIAAVDPRFSSWLVSDGMRLENATRIDWDTAPYKLRVATMQLVCNLFNSIIFQDKMKADAPTRELVGKLVSNGLLSSQTIHRALAGALVFNLAAFDHNERMNGGVDQVKAGAIEGLEEALVQSVISEIENKDTLHSLLLALGMVLYCAPKELGIWDLCDTMDLKQALQSKMRMEELNEAQLLKEILLLCT